MFIFSRMAFSNLCVSATNAAMRVSRRFQWPLNFLLQETDMHYGSAQDFDCFKCFERAINVDSRKT